MLNKKVLSEVLSRYKENLPDWWKNESFKWEAIKCFQDNWNLEVEDFADMLSRSLAKTESLLVSVNNFPLAMIKGFAEADPEAVKGMFIQLFDESKDLYDRIISFKEKSAVMHKKYSPDAKNHYQNENVITTYLWLRYPNKYYIYKYGELKASAVILESDYTFIKGHYSDNIRNAYALFEEMRNIIKQDQELLSIIDSMKNESLYPDREAVTLTNDIGFYISRVYASENIEWWPSKAEYDPGLTVNDWIELLNDPKIFDEKSLQIMKRFLDCDGQATCKQLSVKYGESYNYYNSGSTSLARRIADKLSLEVSVRDTGNSRWWPILYLGRKTQEGEEGNYIWKLRDELKAALGKIDISNIRLYNAPAIWKISHGTDATGIKEHFRDVFEKRKVAVVHSTTKAKATSKISQGEAFMKEIRKGDFFFLCYGSKVSLLGQFTDEKPVLNPEMQDGWYERAYRLIAVTDNDATYTGVRKWWAPSDNSTCIKVDEKDYPLFEDQLLQPYFNMSLEQLISGEKTMKNYWWLNANPKTWSFSGLSVGESIGYTLYNDNGRKRRVFQNFLDAKVGDLIIGYESTPVKKIVALGRVSVEQDGEKIFFEKTEELAQPIDYVDLRNRPELDKMEAFVSPQGSLMKVTEAEYEVIMEMIREDNPLNSTKDGIEAYSKEKFLSDVYMSEETYNRLTAVLKRKKNVILQGAPGVGKTFSAKRLAYSLMGKKDDSRIEFVQFHQNYSYEDFVMGYKPEEDKYVLKQGIFYRFCQQAANHPEQEYFFIIDEINRGNMSKIFGELLMLIENDYRGTKTTLVYTGKPFTVPKNLYVIGMMNTADRSLAMIDYALRRRFAFFEINPGFDSEGFSAYQKSLDNEVFNELIDRIKELNRDIAQDKFLGKGFCIGHSYFCGLGECRTEELQDIVDYDILPMLSEYWFDDQNQYQHWENVLRGIFQ